ncbi:MAG: lytic murein transglycosylase [bacterium]
MLLSLVIALLLPLSPEAPEIPQRRINYVKQQLIENNFTQEKIEELFGDQRLQIYQPPPSGRIDWGELHGKLLSEEALRLGSQFLERYAATFERASLEYGVDKETLASVFGIESFFETNLGNYIVFNVFYYKLSHRDWKKHAEELVLFIMYCTSLNQDCFAITGSHAGAIGPAQFTPSAYEHGRDGSGDGIVDFLNVYDSIMSAANYLNYLGYGQNKERALGRYYGSAANYPHVTLDLAQALRNEVRLVKDQE